MYYNIKNKTTSELMLGEGLIFKYWAEHWLKVYQTKYPQFSFEIVEVTYLNPPWFPTELRS